jgi:hypothetical protein
VVGRDLIEATARVMSPDVTFAERLGDGATTETGTFIFPGRFEWQGDMFLYDLEIELDGDLASRIEMRNYVEEEPKPSTARLSPRPAARRFSAEQ